MYNKKLLTITFYLIISLTLTATLPSCSEDCPVCPESKVEQEKDYHMIYSRVGVDYWVYTFSTKTGETVDSVRYGHHPFHDVKYSPDGKYAYYTTMGGAPGEVKATWVTDYATGDTLIINYDIAATGMNISSDGSYLLVPDQDDPTMFSIPDLSVVYSGEKYFGGGCFHSFKNIAYANVPGRDSLMIINLEVDPISTRKIGLKTHSGIPLRSGSCSVTKDGRTLIMNFGRRPADSYIQLIDTETFEVKHQFSPGISHAIIHPDGMRAFFFQPMTLIGNTFYPSEVWVLDLQSLLMERILYGDDFRSHSQYFGLNPNSFAITPDGRYAIILNGGGDIHSGQMTQGGILIKFDLETYEIADIFYPPDGISRLLRIYPIEIKNGD